MRPRETFGFSLMSAVRFFHSAVLYDQCRKQYKFRYHPELNPNQKTKKPKINRCLGHVGEAVGELEARGAGSK